MIPQHPEGAPKGAHVTRQTEHAKAETEPEHVETAAERAFRKAKEAPVPKDETPGQRKAREDNLKRLEEQAKLGETNDERVSRLAGGTLGGRVVP